MRTFADDVADPPRDLCDALTKWAYRVHDGFAGAKFFFLALAEAAGER